MHEKRCTSIILADSQLLTRVPGTWYIRGRTLFNRAGRPANSEADTYNSSTNMHSDPGKSIYACVLSACRVFSSMRIVTHSHGYVGHGRLSPAFGVGCVIVGRGMLWYARRPMGLPLLWTKNQGFRLRRTQHSRNRTEECKMTG